jgi:DNA-directed RNA polymerase sigma subunit (sigma70/sigma32)
MKDYEVTVKVRNNWLLRAMLDNGFLTGADLSRVSGVDQQTISQMLNLKTTFMANNGDWRPAVIKLSETLKCLPEDLVPPQHIKQILEKNKASFEASLEDVEYLIDSRGTIDPLELLESKERKQVISKVMLKHLSEMEQVVLIYQFGLLDHEPKTLQDLSNMMKITPARVGQIKAKALRKLMNPRGAAPALAEFRP